MKAKCFAMGRRDSGDDFALLLIMLTVLSSLADVFPSLRGPSLSLTDEGVIVSNGDG